ncbi:MAG: DUF2325 domain-containing protein [Rhodocyclaceae bacterium]
MTEFDFERLWREHRALIAEHGRVQTRCSALLAEQARHIEALEAEVMRLRGRVIAGDTALAIAREQRDALAATIPGLPRRLALTRRVDALKARVQTLTRELASRQWRATSSLRGDLRSDAAGLAFVRPAHGATAILDACTQRSAEDERSGQPADPRVGAQSGVQYRGRGRSGEHVPASLAPAVLCVVSRAEEIPSTHQVLAACAAAAGGQAQVTCMEGDACQLEASLRAADMVICQTGCLSHNAYWRVEDHCRRTGKPCIVVNAVERGETAADPE